MGALTHWEGEPVHVWRDVWGVPAFEAWDVIGSTNDRAADLARVGAEPFTVVIAAEQRAGRGRTGAAWHSRAGAGLWMSTLLPVEARVPSWLPLLVGLAAARAAESVAGGVRVGIKWPNDLEIEGRKAGGVLCERAHGPVVAGIGLNVSQEAGDFPAELAERAISLQAAGAGRVGLAAVATALVRELRAACVGAAGGLGAAAHQELAERDVLRGRAVRSEQAGQGTARGIDADGALLLDTADGRRVRVVAGSVRAAPETSRR